MLSMLLLYGTTGFALVFLQLFFWLPAPYQSLNVASPVEVANKSSEADREKNIEGKSSDPLAGLERVTRRIRPGDTLGKLLKTFGLSGQEEHFWIRSIRKHFSPRRLRPGREIYFYLGDKEPDPSKGSGKKQLKALAMEQDDDWVLTWILGEQQISFRKYERPYEIEIKTIGGTITDSLYENGRRLGLPPEVISQLVDIYGWEVNFQAVAIGAEGIS